MNMVLILGRIGNCELGREMTGDRNEMGKWGSRCWVGELVGWWAMQGV